MSIDNIIYLNLLGGKPPAARPQDLPNGGDTDTQGGSGTDDGNTGTNYYETGTS